MSSEYNYNDLVSSLESSYVYNLCLLSGLAMLLYDTTLTLATEIRVAWRRSFTFAGFLHIINRYVQITAYIAALVITFPVSNHICTSFGILEEIATLLPYISWALFTGLRMHAISDGNKVLSVSVFVLNVAYILPDLYEDTHMAFINTPLLGCYQAGTASESMIALLWTSRGTLLLGESIVLFWTVKLTWSQRKNTPSVFGRRETLAQVMLTNGTMCFIVPLLFNATTLGLQITGSDNAMSVEQCIICFRDALTTILISRYLLALGKFGRRGEDELYSTSRASMVDLDPTFISPDPVPGQRDDGDSTDFA
ncbi:hypothetical protein C8Q74DRAFT_1307119 [Fomes fomentarius]|nr:hypothetical protein C8Q74DRAFT_1307119 [Fomes fomentarius]